jgi:hypothetical protein
LSSRLDDTDFWLFKRLLQALIRRSNARDADRWGKILRVELTLLKSRRAAVPADLDPASLVKR